VLFKSDLVPKFSDFTFIDLNLNFQGEFGLQSNSVFDSSLSMIFAQQNLSNSFEVALFKVV
jgi:hypothetical protein